MNETHAMRVEAELRVRSMGKLSARSGSVELTHEEGPWGSLTRKWGNCRANALVVRSKKVLLNFVHFWIYVFWSRGCF